MANITVFHPSLVSRGGSQRYAIESSNCLKSLGHDVRLLTFYYDKDNCYPDLCNEIEISAVKYCKNYKSVENIFKESRFIYKIYFQIGLGLILTWAKNKYLVHKLTKLIDSKPKDYLFVHETGGHNSIAKEYKNADIYVYDTPNKLLEWRKLEGMKTNFSKLVQILLQKLNQNDYLRFYKNIYVLDEEMNKNVNIYYKKNSTILTGAVNINYKKRIPGEPGLVKILCNSRISRYKRIKDLILISDGLRKRGINHLMTINSPVEDYELLSDLRKEINERSLNDLVLLNIEHFQSDEDLIKSYENNDIFIFPNENQTWGNAVLEAMASGMNVIVSDGCGIAKIIDSNNGFTYNVGNIDKVVEIVECISKDASLFESISTGAISTIADNYTWKIWCEKLNYEK